ncbi:hypothetical protein [Pseudomonas serbica]|uniref:hypothetical protein n=1 Tax=Pseudomonas serbica TaxID=2965074 RepID=UPI00237B58CF|nr:hypothetical protein [Pseudomonas serbica]
MKAELTPRLVALMDSSAQCAKVALRALARGAIDIDDFKTIVARLSVIESRSILLIACLNVEEVKADFTEISLPDEIEFMGAAEVFLTEIQAMMDEASE